MLITIGIGVVALLAVLAACLWINEPVHVGPADANLLLQASVTKTASFNSTAIDMGSGFSPAGAGQPVQANISFSAADFTTGDETYTFKLQDSPDNSTFTDISAARSAGVSATVAAAAIAVGGFVRQRYVRLVLTAGGTTPSITYQAYLSPFTVE